MPIYLLTAPGGDQITIRAQDSEVAVRIAMDFHPRWRRADCEVAEGSGFSDDGEAGILSTPIRRHA